MPKKDKGPLNQHYVPRFLLRPWTENGHLIEFDKVSKACRKVGINKAASEFKFYELANVPVPELKDMAKSIELYAGAHEHQAAPVVRKVISSVAGAKEVLSSEVERYRLLLFLAFQFARSPGMRLTLGDIRSWRAQKVFNDYRKRHGHEPISLSELDFEDKTFADNFAKVQQFSVMVEVERLYGVFARLNLNLLYEESSKALLVTSDFPVVGDSETDEFAFPLSPRHIIHLTLEKHREAVRAIDVGRIPYFNSLQVQQGQRIFCTETQLPSIQDLAERNPEWCISAEEVMINGIKEEQANAHWFELPGATRL